MVKCPPSYERGATTFYIGESGLPEGIAIAPVKTATSTMPAQEFWPRNLRLNAPLTLAQFAYIPAPDSSHRRQRQSRFAVSRNRRGGSHFRFAHA